MSVQLTLRPRKKVVRVPFTKKEFDQFYRYEPDTGRIFSINKGKYLTGCVISANNNRYLEYNLGKFGKRRGHQLAVLAMTGEWPPPGYEPDHRDRNGLNNKWSNIRLATKSQQQYNRRLSADHPTGIQGLSIAQNGNIIVRVRPKDKPHFHGTYKTIQEAEAALDQARIDLGIWA